MTVDAHKRWYRIHLAALLVAFAFAAGMYLDPVRSLLVTEPMTVAEIRSMFVERPVETLLGPLLPWTTLYSAIGLFVLYAFMKSERALREGDE